MRFASIEEESNHMSILRPFCSVLAKIAWPAMLVSTCVFLTVVCFGGTRVYWHGGLGFAEIWEHGWPVEFLRRLPAHQSNRFLFWHGWPDQFEPMALALDMLVFALVMGLVIIGPRWLSSRQSPARRGLAFSLSSLFVVLTIACLLMGSIGHYLAVSRYELALGAVLEKQGHKVDYKYLGPIWLARLRGEQDNYQKSVFHGVRAIGLKTGVDDALLLDLSRTIQSLPHLSTLKLYRTRITDAGLKTLVDSKCSSRIQNITFPKTVSGSAFADPNAWPNLRYVNASHSALNDAGFANLASIPSLYQIDATSSKITKKSLAQAASMPNLKYFDARSLGFTEADCSPLKARGVICIVAD